MKPVPEYQRVTDDLFVWQAYNDEMKCDCFSCAIRTPEGFVFVDPIRLEEQALEDLIGNDQVAYIVLTSGNHDRDYVYERKRLDVPVYAHECAGDDIDADRWLRDGDTVADVLKVIALPGGAEGEIALLGNGVLILGDAVVHMDGGLQLLPEKYCENSAQMRVSLKKLLGLDFHTLVLAHGLPITVNAREKLAAVIG